MPIKSPQDLLARLLHDIEDAENEGKRALQQLSQQVESQELRQLLERRIKQGEQVLQGVQKGFKSLGAQSGGAQNRAARGIIEEGRRTVDDAQTPELKQAAAIAAVQALEHYCIAVWGTVKALARETGQQELVQAMERALDDGKRLDEELTELAEGRVNPSALEQGQQAQGGSRGQGEQRSFAGSSGGGDGSDDLKEREYRGEDGQIHHHTREYMERRGEEGR